MATTSAERAKKSRERLKEQLGVEGLKERDHQKYLQKKERAQRRREMEKKEQDLEKAMTFHERMKLFLLFRDLKKALRPQFLNTSGELELANKKRLDTKATELLKTLIYHRSVVDFSVLQELLKRQNLFPEFDHAYFLEVSDNLNGDEAELWECLYFNLYYAEHLQYSDPALIEKELGKMVDRDPQLAFASFVRLCELGAVIIGGSESVTTLYYRGPVTFIERGKGWKKRKNEFPKCPLTATLKTETQTINTVLFPNGRQVSDIVSNQW